MTNASPPGARDGSGNGSPTVALARELIRRASVTPDDAGCQALIGARLAACGFRLESMPAGPAGHRVENLWARLGDAGPTFAFAGHTDVVPTGDASRWSSAPFGARLVDGEIVGRGAADMKGGLAAMVTAAERFAAPGRRARGSVAFLLTSDEEGPAVDGTAHVMRTLAARGETVDWCVLGEPSSAERLGDTIRVGRRGSLGARLVVRGRQGHVAYPRLADNPVHRALPMLAELAGIEWDAGDEHFPPTTLQVSNVAAGTGATNVIPGELVVEFNLRHSPATTQGAIRARVEALVAAHGLDARLDWRDSARPFLTADGALLAAARAAVREVTGIEPSTDTAGGTSDGRFIAPTGTELVELGPVNRTIHAVDERVAASDLDALSTIYERTLDSLLGHD